MIRITAIRAKKVKGRWTYSLRPIAPHGLRKLRSRLTRQQFLKREDKRARRAARK